MLHARDEHGRQVRNPGPTALSRMVANLGRGNAFVIVERVDEETVGDWYVQVWLRDDNTYQLEFRDGTTAEHHQTRTISQEKVITALNGWAKGRSGWKDAFMWNRISTFSPDAD
ncbi:hypothetical protein LG634_35730 [Streptomyces bambusae]|uniref:hypothetical protein n=1 Tax=Streptomyces bambusae TaxID=1550616 RepID=UPI001CFFA00F|nr:hypothetical protein [Streptomyces bambusae]MCB5170138.1 hypothetical protein [Streptomyces bambusae]